MSEYKKGDVVAIPYFSNQEDHSKGTARPILIVDIINGEYFVMPLTSQLHQANNYKKTVLIRQNDETGKRIGLRRDSLVIADRKTKMTLFAKGSHLIGNCGLQFLIDHSL